jgi:hypothetical protein
MVVIWLIIHLWLASLFGAVTKPFVGKVMARDKFSPFWI